MQNNGAINACSLKYLVLLHMHMQVASSYTCGKIDRVVSCMQLYWQLKLRPNQQVLQKQTTEDNAHCLRTITPPLNLICQQNHSFITFNLVLYIFVCLIPPYDAYQFCNMKNSNF